VCVKGGAHHPYPLGIVTTKKHFILLRLGHIYFPTETHARAPYNHTQYYLIIIWYKIFGRSIVSRAETASVLQCAFPLHGPDSLPTVRSTDRPAVRPVHRQRYLADGGDPKTVAHSVARAILKIHTVGVLATTLSVCGWRAARTRESGIDVLPKTWKTISSVGIEKKLGRKEKTPKKSCALKVLSE